MKKCLLYLLVSYTILLGSNIDSLFNRLSYQKDFSSLGNELIDKVVLRNPRKKELYYSNEMKAGNFFHIIESIKLPYKRISFITEKNISYEDGLSLLIVLNKKLFLHRQDYGKAVYEDSIGFKSTRRKIDEFSNYVVNSMVNSFENKTGKNKYSTSIPMGKTVSINDYNNWLNARLGKNVYSPIKTSTFSLEQTSNTPYSYSSKIKVDSLSIPLNPRLSKKEVCQIINYLNMQISTYQKSTPPSKITIKDLNQAQRKKLALPFEVIKEGDGITPIKSDTVFFVLSEGSSINNFSMSLVDIKDSYKKLIQIMPVGSKYILNNDTIRVDSIKQSIVIKEATSTYNSSGEYSITRIKKSERFEAKDWQWEFLATYILFPYSKNRVNSPLTSVKSMQLVKSFKSIGFGLSLCDMNFTNIPNPGNFEDSIAKVMNYEFLTPSIHKIWGWGENSYSLDLSLSASFLSFSFSTLHDQPYSANLTFESKFRFPLFKTKSKKSAVFSSSSIVLGYTLSNNKHPKKVLAKNVPGFYFGIGLNPTLWFK